MCQCRPADPTDPGDAADLSIMGYLADPPALAPRAGVRLVLAVTVAQDYLEINTFLTKPRGPRRLR